MSEALITRMEKQLAEWDADEPRADWWQYQRDFAEILDLVKRTGADAEGTTSEAKVQADAELAAEVVAQRCSTGRRRDGSPTAPTRHAIIWQAARLGALEYAKMTKGSAR